MSDIPTASHGRNRMVEAIANGTVIDHIPAAVTLKVAALVSGPDDQVFIGQNLRSARLGRKGVVKVSGRLLTGRDLQTLALIAPGASICIIRNYEIAEKRPVGVPDLFEAIARCANPNCVTNHERWPTLFDVTHRDPLLVRCRYCERTVPAADLALLPR